MFWFAKEPAACIFAIDDGSGAAEVEVDSCDGVFREFLSGADKFWGVLADHLRDDGLVGRVFRDGSQDIGVEI